jgi:putative SOS response-associated peptidase YedK
MGDKASGERLKSCAIRITESNNFVAQLHGRMPVILDAKDFQPWEQGDVKDAAALMRPASADLLVQRPVSKRVNGSRADNNDAALIDRVGADDNRIREVG